MPVGPYADTRSSIQSGPDWAGVGDFTGDGRADIAWYEQWQNKISVLASTGHGFNWSTGMTGIGGPDWASSAT